MDLSLKEIHLNKIKENKLVTEQDGYSYNRQIFESVSTKNLTPGIYLTKNGLGYYDGTNWFEAVDSTICGVLTVTDLQGNILKLPKPFVRLDPDKLYFYQDFNIDKKYRKIIDVYTINNVDYFILDDKEYSTKINLG